mgnify:CR=1 FL=1
MATKIINIIRTAPIANGIHIGQKHHHQEIVNTPVIFKIHNKAVRSIVPPPKLIFTFLLIILSLMVHILNHIVH